MQGDEEQGASRLQVYERAWAGIELWALNEAVDRWLEDEAWFPQPSKIREIAERYMRRQRVEGTGFDPFRTMRDAEDELRLRDRLLGKIPPRHEWPPSIVDLEDQRTAKPWKHGLPECDIFRAPPWSRFRKGTKTYDPVTRRLYDTPWEEPPDSEACDEERPSVYEGFKAHLANVQAEMRERYGLAP